jgi:hypothetical protein
VRPVTDKIFLVLFFKKELLPSSCAYQTIPKYNRAFPRANATLPTRNGNSGPCAPNHWREFGVVCWLRE